MILVKLFLINLITVILFTTAQEEVGDVCESKNGGQGTCTVITSCAEAVKELKAKRRHSQVRCGFEGMTEIVCCTDVDSKFGPAERLSINSRRIAEDECNKINLRPPLDTHIIGGEKVFLGEFPHLAALAFPVGDGTYKFDCGGTIISNRFVLTAAHCVDNSQRITPAFIRAGVVDLGENTYNEDTDVGVAEIIKHTNYSRNFKYHDICLLRLNKTLTFSNNLNAACIETNFDVPTFPLEVSGWGLTSNTRDIKSNVLMKTKVTSVATGKCNEWYDNMRKLPQGIIDGQFCAGDKTGQHDTCQGDSGGPATITNDVGKYKVVGVTSYGRGCGSEVPAVYTRVSHYVDWIVSVVWPQ